MDRLLTQKEAMELTGMSAAWFEINRCKGVGISYIKLGRAVRYRLSAIEEYINANEQKTGG